MSGSPSWSKSRTEKARPSSSRSRPRAPETSSKPAPAVVAQEHVALVPGDRAVGHQPVEPAPGVVVRGAGRLGERRPCHDAAPEQLVEVEVAPLAGDHAVHAEDVFPAVAVEVEGTRGPRPAAHLGAGRHGDVLEGAVAAVAEERVPPRMVMVERPHAVRRLGHEVRAARQPQAGVAPHLPAVDVLPAVAVEVEPEDAHAGRVVLDAGPGGDVLEAHLPVPQPQVVVQVLSPEVVGDDQVGPAVPVVVAPGGREAEAVVARVQAHLVGHLDEPPVAVVAEEDVGRAVERVVDTAWACPPSCRRRRRCRSRRTGTGRGTRRGRSRRSPSPWPHPARGARSGSRPVPE